VHNADGTWSIDPQTVSHLQVHTDDHDGAQSVYQVSVTTTGPDGVTAEIIHSGHITYNAVIDSSVTLESGLSGTQSSDVFGQVTTVDISASGTLQHIGELLNFTQSDNDESTMLQIRVADGVNIYRPNGLSTYTVSNDIYTDANGINSDRDPGYQTFQVPASALDQAIIMSSSGALTSTDIRIRVEIHEGTGGTGANVSETFHFTGATLSEHNFIPTTATTISALEDVDHSFTSSDFGFSDGDAGDVLDHITITTLPDIAEGQLLFNGVAVKANQQINNADIGKLTFTPANDVVGDVHFGYTVSDGKNDSSPSTATITIANVNDLPTVVATTNSTTEDTDITITKAQLLAGATDIDKSDVLDINTVSVNGGHGTVTDNGNGTWTLHPDTNFKGDITLAYKVNDGHVDVDNHMTVSVSTVTDTATSSLSLTAEQQVMKFSPASGGGLTNNGNLKTGGDIDNLAVEFNVIGGPTAPPAGHNGPTFISYGTSHSENEFYVWNPTDLTIRIDGTEYKTGISATDGLTHRYSVLWSSSTGHLEMLVDGESKWVHSGPVAQGYKIPGNGILAVGNDQDHYNVETGSHADHGFSTADAFHGQIFSASLANAHVTASQLEDVPLSSVVDKDNGLVIDLRANSAGQFVDQTGHHQVTATTDIQSETTLVDTHVAIPNPDALIHLSPTVTASTDSDDVITKVELTGLLTGTVVDDGHGHQHTVTSMTDLLDIKDWDLSTLTAQLPGTDTHNMNIGLIVTTEGPDGVVATDSHYQALVLDPTQAVPIPPVIGSSAASADEPDLTDDISVTLVEDSSVVASAPVDHYLQMLGIERQYTPSPDADTQGDMNFVTGGGDSSDTSLDPLLDVGHVDPFHNPLDDGENDESKHQEIDHLVDNIEDNHDLSDSITDDDSLQQALNDMHNQF
jgi:hypothetical protein